MWSGVLAAVLATTISGGIFSLCTLVVDEGRRAFAEILADDIASSDDCARNADDVRELWQAQLEGPLEALGVDRETTRRFARAAAEDYVFACREAVGGRIDVEAFCQDAGLSFSRIVTDAPGEYDAFVNSCIMAARGTPPPAADRTPPDQDQPPTSEPTNAPEPTDTPGPSQRTPTEESVSGFIELSLVNTSGRAACDLYLKEPGELVWGGDLLGDEVVLQGETFTLQGIRAGTYDIKVEDCDLGPLYEASDVDLTQSYALTVTE